MKEFKKIDAILADEPVYRLEQIKKARFDVNVNGYGEITTLPLALRDKLKDLPWLSVEPNTLAESKVDSTKKALLRLSDGQLIETVLMGRENKKGTRQSAERYTICVSSQAGCAMRCAFCATGLVGFRRNLTAEEIVDQYRFWQRYLHLTTPKSLLPRHGRGKLHEGRLTISNIVVMGQGEPLLNYDNLKQALNTIIIQTEIGPTKITISTCGVRAGMERMVEDEEFPQVRFALSLHSAIEETRTRIMPVHQKGFLDFFVKWAEEYHRKIPSRTHFIGLEYIMLDGFNDDERHLKALIKFASRIPRVRINLIPYNNTEQNNLTTSGNIKLWQDKLMKAGFVCTIRHSQGQDIAAACGQLRNALMD